MLAAIAFGGLGKSGKDEVESGKLRTESQNTLHPQTIDQNA